MRNTTAGLVYTLHVVVFESYSRDFFSFGFVFLDDTDIILQLHLRGYDIKYYDI